MEKRENVQQALEYILSIPKFVGKNTFADTQNFYAFLGKPGASIPTIHVAGTNGKGSTCAYIESCLRAGGYSVGMFTSPHLVRITERIRIDGEQISAEEFLIIFHRLQERVAEYKEKYKAYHPSFFEWLFLMNMLYVEEKKPQILILETGLGGRLDATNIVESPLVCVITSIGLDHQEYLGSSYEEITREKAGIIKGSSKVVYGQMRPECEAIIEERSSVVKAFCRRVSKEQETGFDLRDKKIDFSFYSRYYGYIPLRMSTIALYQVHNARLALTALEEAGIRLTQEQLMKGIENCCWEGRMEEVLPEVFLDGAHNQEGIEAFLETVRQDGCLGRRYLVFGAVQDKEVGKIAHKLEYSGLFSCIHTVDLQNERGMKAKRLRTFFNDIEIIVEEGTRQALENVLFLQEEGDRIYFVGSLYLVGEVKSLLSTEKISQ